MCHQQMIGTVAGKRGRTIRKLGTRLSSLYLQQGSAKKIAGLEQGANVDSTIEWMLCVISVRALRRCRGTVDGV